MLMKRINHLYGKIYSLQNLILADQKARKGKTKSYGVKLFDKDPLNKLIKLQDDLRNHRYKTSPYTTFTIYEPKERLIFRLPYYPDRIVHHAIMNIMEPIWVNIFTKNTYSCIKGRGIHKLVNDLKKALKSNPEGTKYCLKLDVKKFYPSINHDILKEIIRRKIKDEELLQVLDEIIDSAEGVPIGNYLSQYLANLYLTYFDHWIKEVLGIKHYFRYCDDITILSNSKEQLHKWLIEIQKYLDVNLKLQIKSNWQIYPVESRGIDFVGYVFKHDYTKLRKSIKHNLFIKVSGQSKQFYCKEDRIKNIGSYFGWLKYCNSKHLKRKLNNKYNDTIFPVQHISRKCAAL